MSEQTKTMWAANFRYGTPSLAKLEIFKENAGSVWVSSYENVIGWQHFGTPDNGSGRNSKSRRDFSFSLFSDRDEALDHLALECQQHVENLKRSINKTLDAIADIKTMKGPEHLEAFLKGED